MHMHIISVCMYIVFYTMKGCLNKKNHTYKVACTIHNQSGQQSEICQVQACAHYRCSYVHRSLRHEGVLKSKVINTMFYVIYNNTQINCHNTSMCIYMHTRAALMCTEFQTMKQCSNQNSHKYKFVCNIQYYSDQCQKFIMFIHMQITAFTYKWSYIQTCM